MKNKKKIQGFTLIELVIVIAIIAILAAVLIPTFTSVLRNAEKSAAMQQIAASYKEALANALIDDGEIHDGDSETVNGFTFEFANNGANASVTVPQDFAFSVVSIQNGIVVFGDNPVDNPVISVTGITLNESVLNLTVGQNSTLIATIAPDNATDKTVVWTTSNPSAATVDNGTVTAVGAGNATITASSGGYSAVCEVTITPATVPVTGITLDESVLNLTVGQNSTLIATVAPDNATDKTVVWTTSNPSAATVDNGAVTAVGAGNATITASSGGYSAVCEVTVITVFTVTNNDTTHVTVTGVSSVTEGTQYTSTVTVDIGYNIIVTMGGNTISNAYTPANPTSGTITINNVSGDIVISTVSAANFSNSNNANWKTGTRLGSDGTERTDSPTCVATNFFNVQELDTLYIKNLELIDSPAAHSAYYRSNNSAIVTFKKTFGQEHNQMLNFTQDDEWTKYTIQCKNSTTISDTSVTDTVDHMRISGVLFSGKTKDDVLIYIWRNGAWVIE